MFVFELISLQFFNPCFCSPLWEACVGQTEYMPDIIQDIPWWVKYLTFDAKGSYLLWLICKGEYCGVQDDNR